MSRLLMVCLLCYSAMTGAETEAGRLLGAGVSEIPHWFKQSFLELEEDIAEASAQGKRLMLYFHQKGCPYCAQLIEESFADPGTAAFIRQHFDAIALNLWGDRELVSVSGQSFSEKTFAAALAVQYTPTLIFFDENTQVILRLNGYHPPAEFRRALDYAASKDAHPGGFSAYLSVHRKAETSTVGLIAEDFYSSDKRLDQLMRLQNDRPLAVFFEAENCQNCTIMHEQILTDAPTRKLVEAMTTIQLDIHSNESIRTPDGRSVRISQWVRELGIDFTPAVVFFDSSGRELMRLSAFVKTFHFQSVFAYIHERAYLHEPNFQRYLSARGEEIREAGFDTDIWGYQSDYQ